MPARRKVETKTRSRKPATTPEGREQQLVAQAIDLAEQQIQNGTASSQVITHFLKLGSTRERIEQERIIYENELTKVKIESMESQKHMEELYLAAINAMKMYAGNLSESDHDAPG